MMLPNADEVRVDQAKIVDYLLSLSHPDGRSKAAFFMRFGFCIAEWKALAEALREVGISNPVASEVGSSYGRRYTVDGPRKHPMAADRWFVPSGSSSPEQRRDW
jgi:hypothetical protein